MYVLLFSIFNRIHNQDDRKSFSQVCKQFWKISSCVRHKYRLHIIFPEFLDHILPVASPYAEIFECHTPLLSNDHIKHLARSCPKLSFLDISLNKCFEPHDEPDNLHVSDVGVVSLVLHSVFLTSLDLSGRVNVTDESLKAIGESSSTRLNILSLAGCRRITDLGLEYLAKGKVRNCLWQLNLAECDRISDDGIVWLKEMCRLVDLNLSKCGTNVTDRGVQAAMSQIPGMYELNLSWLIKVTDVSMFVIGEKCRNLASIKLMGCEGVTGKGLLAFSNHIRLHTIDLFSCHQISRKHVESFIVARRRYIKCRKIYIRMPDSIDDSDEPPTRKYFTGRGGNDQTDIMLFGWEIIKRLASRVYILVHPIKLHEIVYGHIKQAFQF